MLPTAFCRIAIDQSLAGGVSGPEHAAGPGLTCCGPDLACLLACTLRKTHEAVAATVTLGTDQRGSLSLTLGNFAGLSAARDPKHRIVLDDLMSAFEHEFHASHVAKSCPAAFHI